MVGIGLGDCISCGRVSFQPLCASRRQSDRTHEDFKGQSLDRRGFERTENADMARRTNNHVKVLVGLLPKRLSGFGNTLSADII